MSVMNKTLLTHELNEQFKIERKSKQEIANTLISILITLLIAFVFIFVFYKVTDTYVSIKVNKVLMREERAKELLSVFYFGLMIANVVFATSKLYKTLSKPDKILLTLPVKPEEIFVSKFISIFISQFIFIVALIIPVNIIFAIATKPSFTFWLLTAVVCLLMPIISFAIASLIVYPCMAVVRFIKTKYILIAISFVILIGSGFYLYSVILNIFRTLLEVGSIRYLFNEKTLNVIQWFYKWMYPSNMFSKIVYADSVIFNIGIVLAISVLAFLGGYFMTKKLFFKVLYYSNIEQIDSIRHKEKVRSPLRTLIHKELIEVYRTPKYLFQCFALALSLPLITYCCVTMFDNLIKSTLGMDFAFEISLFSLLIFSVLMNTFSSTNISREGTSIMVLKTIPCEDSKIVWSKVIFQTAINAISILLSLVIICIFMNVKYYHVIFLAGASLIFTVANVLLATKLDLNKPAIHNPDGTGSATSIFIFIGLIVSLIITALAIVLRFLRNGNTIGPFIRYGSIALLVCIYFVITYLFYRRKLKDRFNVIS